MDDLEFLGQRQGLGSRKFLTLPQIKDASLILNRMAYFIFSEEQTMEFFQAFELNNLKEVLMRLVNRDNRTGVFEKDFWVLEKAVDIERKIYDLS